MRIAARLPLLPCAALLAGAVAGLCAAADPLPAPPAPRYVPPDTTVHVFENAKLRTPPDVLARTATLLAACVQKNHLHESEKTLPLCGRMLGLALQMDPANAAASNLNSRLGSARPVPPADSAAPGRAAAAAQLFKLSQQCRDSGSMPDRKLGLYLLALANELDPANQEVADAAAVFEKAGISADWGFAAGAAAAPQPPPRLALLPAVNPAYAQRDKKFAVTQTTVHGLVVLMGENGLMFGEVMDIIGTVSPGSGQVAFARPVGREMGISCGEARRAAQVRYPFWEPARVTVSFGEKYSAKDGGSAGGAFALLFLALLDGISIDGNFAMTGDIAVDWRILKVGAVAEKVRGAGRAGRTLVAVPKDNEREIADMTLLYPPDVLLGVQVFGVSELGEVVELARADRAAELTAVLERYRNVQQLVRRSSLLAISQAPVQKELAAILRAAPNHLSAKYLLQYAQGRSPLRLSLATSLQQVIASTGPLLVFLAPVAPAEVDMPDEAYKRARQGLADLRNKLDKDAEPLHAALLNLVTTLEQMHRIQVSSDTPSLKKTKLKTYETKLESDRQKVLSILQALQENKEFLARIMGG